MNLNAITKGELVNLETIPDEMFSQRLLGDGYAINPESNWIYSPCDGEIVMVFPTKHALGIKADDGTDIMLHIGVDTVNLNGEPFDVYVNVGDHVKKGELLMSSDYELIKKKGLCNAAITIITSGEIEHIKESGHVEETDIVANTK